VYVAKVQTRVCAEQRLGPKIALEPAVPPHRCVSSSIAHIILSYNKIGGERTPAWRIVGSVAVCFTSIRRAGRPAAGAQAGTACPRVGLLGVSPSLIAFSGHADFCPCVCRARAFPLIYIPA
jgi:hypothetical protein